MAELVFNTAQTSTDKAVIKVIGVGGGGCNTIKNMAGNTLNGVELICANTDAQSMESELLQNRLQLGKNLTKGLGAGGDPQIGRNAALEDREAIADAIRGANMLFITTGMGGGTGTGASPVVAEIAREMGILTVAVVTRPFTHEGKAKEKKAKEGLDLLKETVDSLIVIPNDKLMTVLGEDVTVCEAFRAADDVLSSAVIGISEVITSPGIINTDFADVSRVMEITGIAMMGSAEVSGEDRARLATEHAIASPLLDDISLEGAKGVLVSITTAPGCLKLSEYSQVLDIINRNADENAHTKVGTAENENMAEDALRITLIATGLEENQTVGQESLLKVVSQDVVGEATGTDNAFSIDNVVQSGRRRSRVANMTAADFRNQAVLDQFEFPTVMSRQAD